MPLPDLSSSVQQEDRRLFTCPVAGVLRRVSGPVTGGIVPLGVEVWLSFVLLALNRRHSSFTMLDFQPIGTRMGSHLPYVMVRLFEDQGGRTWLSTPIVSLNIKT